MINTKPFALSVGTGIILGLEKIKGNFPFGVVKNKDNRLLSGIYLAPQVEIPLYKNFILRISNPALLQVSKSSGQFSIHDKSRFQVLFTVLTTKYGFKYPGKNT